MGNGDLVGIPLGFWLVAAALLAFGFTKWVKKVRRAIHFNTRRERVFEEARRWNDGLLIADYRDEQALAALQHQVLDPVPRRIERTEGQKHELGVAPRRGSLGIHGSKRSTKEVKEFLEDTENADSRLKILLDRLAGWAVTEAILNAVFENVLSAERENHEKQRAMFNKRMPVGSPHPDDDFHPSHEEVKEQNRIDEASAASATLKAASAERLLLLLAGDWNISSADGTIGFERTIRLSGVTERARASLSFDIDQRDLGAQSKHRFLPGEQSFAGVLALAESCGGQPEHLNLRPLAIFDTPSVSLIRAEWFEKRANLWIFALPPGLKHLAWRSYLRRERRFSDEKDASIDRYGLHRGKMPQSVAASLFASTYRKPS